MLERLPAQAAGRPVIAVGPGAAKSAAPELDLTKAGPAGLGEDGIVLKSVGRNLILTGAEGSKRGTLYAVSEFLEREVGVRWWTHAEEFVPRQPSLAVGPLDCATSRRFSTVKFSGGVWFPMKSTGAMTTRTPR